MPEFDVTIFNVAADEPGGDDAIAQVVGAEAKAGASAVSTSQQANDVDVAVVGAQASAQAGTASAVTDFSGDTFINRINTWGGNMNSGIQNIFDPTDDRYIWARVTNFCQFQIRNLNGGSRATNIQDLKGVRSDNPLIFGAMHDKPTHTQPAYEDVANRFTAYPYKYANTHPRSNALAYIDHDLQATEIHGTEQPASGSQQTAFAINFADTGVQGWYSDAVYDTLVGSNLASNPSVNANAPNTDISDWVGWFFDATQIVVPNVNAKFQRVQFKGVLLNVSVSNSHVTSVVIDGTPGVGVEGEDIFFMNPSGIGFIGYQINKYTSVGSDAVLSLLSLPNSAASSQDTVPAIGWLYCISNSGSTTQFGDWNQDGIVDSPTLGSAVFHAGFLDFWNQLDQKMRTNLGHGSGIGFNALSRSYTRFKESTGWPETHALSFATDYPLWENFSGAMGFRGTGVAGEYEITGSFSPERVMMAMNFAANFIKTPNDFMINKARGAMLEFNVSGTAYSQLGLIDARFLEWYWAAQLSVPDIAFNSLIEELANAFNVAIEHLFLDLDTNFTGAPQFGTYDEGGGPIGTNGPVGSWTWSTSAVGDLTDNGRRIYIRRYGDFIVAVNMGDEPAGYPSLYSLTFPARNPEDIILPTDFAALVSGGMLGGGESLQHIDYSTYVNSRITSFNQSEAPSVWSGFNYGPQQVSPFDSVATGSLATAEWLLRDPGRNDGTAVNTTQNYELPVFNAVVWQVV